MRIQPIPNELRNLTELINNISLFELNCFDMCKMGNWELHYYPFTKSKLYRIIYKNVLSKWYTKSELIPSNILKHFNRRILDYKLNI